jgi:hypothetical protein
MMLNRKSFLLQKVTLLRSLRHVPAPKRFTYYRPPKCPFGVLNKIQSSSFTLVIDSGSNLRLLRKPSLEAAHTRSTYGFPNGAVLEVVIAR